jgi:hypothetical protein
MPESSENQAPQMGASQPNALPPTPQFVPAPPARQGSSTLKIVLTILAVLVGIGVIGAGVVGYRVWRFAKTMHTTSSDQFTERDLGIAIYPGATPSKIGMRMKMGNRTMVSAFYTTPDSTDQVIAFYKDNAGPDARITTLANVTRIHVPTIGGESVIVEISPFPDASGNKTRINIVHVSKAADSN